MEPMWTFSLLRDITDGFSQERLIGGGGYGDVYKGVFADGQIIAVRKLKPLQGIDAEQFQNHCEILMKVEHRNIVPLLDYCYVKEHVLLPYNGRHVFVLKTDMVMCYEYMQNGSLDRYISDISSGLDWHVRYQITIGISEGLGYIHDGLKSFHMNLKPSNILLDRDMIPKIGDFGVQRIFGEGNIRSSGTIEYMPPEFVERQVISHKFDIFSLGVIIIKLLTGERFYSGHSDISCAKFMELALQSWRERLQKTENGMLVERYCEQVRKCLETALKCVEFDRHDRPSIGEIIHKLNETETLIPKEVRVVQNQCSSRKSLLLDVQPLDLYFPFIFKGRNKSIISCSLQLVNGGDDRVAFILVANSPKMYFTKKPLYGVVPPRSVYSLTLTKLKQTPPTTSNHSDFFTLYSVVLGLYDLSDVDKDYTQYENFFKESTKYGDEVQVVTLKVICDQPDAKSAGTSSEIITTPDAQQVSSIDVHPTEPWLMTTNCMGILCVWNYHTMATLDSFLAVAYQPVHAAKFIAREKCLVAGDEYGGIHVYNYDQNQHIESFDGHDSCVTSLAVHPTAPFVLSSSSDDDHLIKLWDWGNGWKCTRIFQGHTDRVTQVTFNPEDKDSFASASCDGTIKIWRLYSDDPKNIITLKLKGHTDRCRPRSLLCVDYFTLQNWQHLIVGCQDKTAQIWKLGVDACFGKLEGHAGHISAIKLHPELPLLITGSLDGTIRIWNSTSYKLESIIDFNLGAVYAFGCIRGSTRITVGCHQGLVMTKISLPQSSCQ